jgi:hypothetical protein
MAQRRLPGSGRTMTDRQLPPTPYPGATTGQQARAQNMPITGERRPAAPSDPYKGIVDYLVDAIARRMVEEFSNQKMPSYQPPWVVPPFSYKPIHQTDGAGNVGVPFIPDLLPPGGVWTVITTINVPRGYYGTIDKFGFDLVDPLGGPVNVPYQTTMYRIRENNTHTILGPTFGAYGTVQDPYLQYICHVYPGRPITFEFANTHPALTWNISARAGGWQYKVAHDTGRNGSVGITD